MALFETIINSRWLLCSTKFLFMNKMDFLEESVQHSDLRDFFPEYDGIITMKINTKNKEKHNSKELKYALSSTLFF